MSHLHERYVTFDGALPDGWEVHPGKDWTCHHGHGRLHLTSLAAGKAEVYQRSCHLPGDVLTLQLDREAPAQGVLLVKLMSGFEYVALRVDLGTGELTLRTHEFHHQQPRLVAQVPAGFSELTVLRQSCSLPGLAYKGSRLTILADGEKVATHDAIDLLPECLTAFGLDGPGQVTVRSWSHTGGARPRPEFTHVGIWQQGIKPSTQASVDGLILGVRQAADAGVKILVTPETSLTSLRPDSPELNDEAGIQSELRRFQEAVAGIPNAPYTLVGYPDWLPGAAVAAATLDRVKVNCHRFVAPDGHLGPFMAKVHSCEEGLWHGRQYNLQRVAGVEVAVGICHDGRYADVWTTGVMGGARLCLHPSAGGTPRGTVPDIRARLAAAGVPFESYWVHASAGGGSAIVYPTPNATVTDTLIGVGPDLSTANPGYPAYSPMDDLLIHTRLRVWDATGCWPMRTLRSGHTYPIWKQLVPTIFDV